MFVARQISWLSQVLAATGQKSNRPPTCSCRNGIATPFGWPNVAALSTFVLKFVPRLCRFVMLYPSKNSVIARLSPSLIDLESRALNEKKLSPRSESREYPTG